MRGAPAPRGWCLCPLPPPRLEAEKAWVGVSRLHPHEAGVIKRLVDSEEMRAFGRALQALEVQLADRPAELRVRRVKLTVRHRDGPLAALLQLPAGVPTPADNRTPCHVLWNQTSTIRASKQLAGFSVYGRGAGGSGPCSILD